MDYLNEAIRMLHTQASRVAGRRKTWWRHHRERMAEDSGYAEAFATILLAAAELLTKSHRARYLVRALVDAYVALLRLLTGESGWEPSA